MAKCMITCVLLKSTVKYTSTIYMLFQSKNISLTVSLSFKIPIFLLALKQKCVHRGSRNTQHSFPGRQIYLDYTFLDPPSLKCCNAIGGRGGGACIGIFWKYTRRFRTVNSSKIYPILHSTLSFMSHTDHLKIPISLRVSSMDIFWKYFTNPPVSQYYTHKHFTKSAH